MLMYTPDSESPKGIDSGFKKFENSKTLPKFENSKTLSRFENSKTLSKFDGSKSL